MTDSLGSISLLDLLACLLADHTLKEAKFVEAQQRHAKKSKFIGDERKGDPPIWEPTPLDRAVVWLAGKSMAFQKVGAPEHGDAITLYEQQLRRVLAGLKFESPAHSPVAAELLEFERQGLGIEMFKAIESELPVNLLKKLSDTTQEIACNGTAIPGDHQPPRDNENAKCYVTLLQMSAIVNRDKRTLERLVSRKKIPSPAVRGGRGKPGEWLWDDVRPILEAEYGRSLPEIFPAHQFVR